MEWFKFHTIWGSGLKELSDAEAGRFVKSLCDYVETGKTEAQSGNEKFLLSIALKQMEKDTAHAAKISSVRAEARRGKGLNSEQLLSNDNNCYQMITKKTNDNNSSIKNKELRIKNKEKDFNTCAEAQNVTETSKLTPNDHNFWKFAKENAELAEAFYKASGIYPIGSQFGRWVKDLKDFREAGITISQMESAVRKIRAEGRITISAPGSVLSTARYIASGGAQRQQVQQPPRNYSFAEVYEMNQRGEL